MIDTSGRTSKRTPVTLKIKFKSATLDQFIERYAVDVSHGGIFIRTKDPLAVGTQLRFEFQLQDASPLISGEGTVVWTREFDPSRVGVAPGMGVRFDKLGPDSQVVLDRILVQKNKDLVEPKFDGSPSQVMTKITPPGLAGTLAQQGRTPGAAVRATTSPASPPPVHKQTILGLGTPDRPVPRVGHLAPPRGGFPEEPSKDATPLPKPMPFHAIGDDDFSDDVFDQPTKVASLENLLRHEEEQARATREAAHDDLTPTPDADTEPEPIGARALTEDDLADAKTSVRRKPDAAVVVPQVLGFEGGPRRESGGTRPRTGPIPLVEGDEPRFLKDSRPLARPSSPKSVVGAEPPRGSWMPLAVASAIGLLAIAGGIYFFVVRPSEEPGPRTRPGVPTEVAKPTPPAAAPTVAVAVTSTPAGAAVELDGETKGPTPAQLDGLDPSKTYKLLVKAPCYKEEAVDLSPKEGIAVDVKLTPLDRVLRVATQPDGARLSINGKAVGRAPSEVKMGTAPQTVRAVLPGYAASELTVPVDAPCVTDGNVGVLNVKVTLAETPAETKPAPPTPKPGWARPETKPETRIDTKPETKAAAPRPARPAKPPGESKPPKDKYKAIIVSPLQPVPTADDPPKAGPSDPSLEPPKEKPPEPAVEPPKEKPPEAAPPKEASKTPAPVKEKPSKEKIAPPKEQPLPNKECDPSPEAPEWARCK